MVATGTPFRVRDEDGNVLAGHENEYGDDTPATILGGTPGQRRRLDLIDEPAQARQ